MCPAGFDPQTVKSPVSATHSRSPVLPWHSLHQVVNLSAPFKTNKSQVETYTACSACLPACLPPKHAAVPVTVTVRNMKLVTACWAVPRDPATRKLSTVLGQHSDSSSATTATGSTAIGSVCSISSRQQPQLDPTSHRQLYVICMCKHRHTAKLWRNTSNTLIH
jgi:hypothetical protein